MRALGLVAAFRPSARASKGILHTRVVTEVKFLIVIMYNRFLKNSWEPLINHLKEKLISSIIVIKRIKRIKQFIPKNEYLKNKQIVI